MCHDLAWFRIVASCDSHKRTQRIIFTTGITFSAKIDLVIITAHGHSSRPT